MCKLELEEYLKSTKDALSQGSEGQLDIDKDSIAYKPLINCLERYGNIYKQLGIRVFVNIGKNVVIFPGDEQLKANYKIFKRNYKSQIEIGNPSYTKRLEIYNLLFRPRFREIYNDYLMNNKYNKDAKIYTAEYTKGGKGRKQTKRRL